MQLEFDNEREELRGKYRTERRKLQDEYAAKEKTLFNERIQAQTAEEAAKREYEKWVRRNRPANDAAPDIELSPEQMLAFSYIVNTKKNLFIQGQAGTGKSTLINYLKTHCQKKMLLASPTGAAAYIIGGATIHSIFGIAPKSFINIAKLSKSLATQYSQTLLKEAELIVIDEASMINPNILDVIDWTAKVARENSRPFGGLQMVLIGDLFQLPPVIDDSVVAIFKALYGHGNAYFFDAPSFKEGKFSSISLSTVFRQNDAELLANLDRILKQDDISRALEYFNSAKFTDEAFFESATSLTPTNKAADAINKIRLRAINGQSRMYRGIVWGEFNLKNAPARPKLELKVGAFVLFTNNHFSIRNGTRAIVTELGDDFINVRLLERDIEIEVRRDTWENIRYEISPLTKEIEEEQIGTYSQFPLQLGYAMTVHKAQGKTLDKAVIEKMHSRFFTHGHAYVALSRTRQKSDMHVAVPLTTSDILIDRRVVDALGNPNRYGFNRLSMSQN